MAEGIRDVRRLFQAAQNPPRWPMYIRQAKQFLRNVGVCKLIGREHDELFG